MYDPFFNNLENYTIKGNENSFCGVKVGVPGNTQGAYYVKVSSTDRNYSAIPYGIRINYTASDVWEKEVNDDYSNANKIELEKLYYGSLQMNEDTDWYKFTVPSAGNYRLLFDHEYIESSLDYWRVIIYDSRFQELVSYVYKGNKKTRKIS